MDTVLARTLSERPENKIAMKRPSWPNTPLHQYFGAKSPNRKNMDFVFSSLGYLRLYEYCWPCEKFTEQQCQDSGYGSSFVHLEERHRSDGPYTLYRRQQRKFGIGLTERAREKRLLRYYKYFQGFQRKLQVSKQFEQDTQKQESKARVEKIMNFYQPSPKPLLKSSRQVKEQKDVTAPATNLPAAPLAKDVVSKKRNSKSNVANTKDLKEINDKKKHNINSDKKPVDATITEPVVERAFTSATSSPEIKQLLPRMRERCSIISTILATIEEYNSDCEDLEPGEHNESKGSSESSLLKDRLELVNSKQLSNAVSIAKSQSRLENSQPAQLRGILKYPQPKNEEHEAKCKEHDKEASKVLDDQATLIINMPTKRGHRSHSRKHGRASVEKKAAEDPVSSPVGDSLKFYGCRPVLSNEGTLKQQISQKELRVRPSLRRFSPGSVPSAPSSQDSEASLDPEAAGSKDTDEDASSEDIAERDSPKSQQRSHRHSHQYNQSRRKEAKPRGASMWSQKIQPAAVPKIVAMRPERAIKFDGWDLRAPLAAHSLKKLPDEKDLSKQLLERAEKLNWDVLEKVDTHVTMPIWTTPKSEEPKVYVEDNGILQIFEHLTQKILSDQSSSSMAVLQAASHDLAVQRAQHTNIQKDMVIAKMTEKPRQACNYEEMQAGCARSKAQPKPRYRIHAYVPNKIPPSIHKMGSYAPSDDEEM